VVEVEVAEQDVGDVAELVAGGADRLGQADRPGLEAVAVDELGLVLVADPGVDQEEVVAARDQQAVGSHADAVALVGPLLLLPQHPRHHPEHGPAVQAELAIPDTRQLEVPQLHTERSIPEVSRADKGS
jgi:hypothetical protein